MRRISIAVRALFAALCSAATAEQIKRVLDGCALRKVTQDETGQQNETKPKPITPAQTPPKRSEAIALLATLQREARLVDLIQQPLGQYTDEQIGAAARNVLGDAAGVLARFFSLRPVRTEDEGTLIDVPAGYDPAGIKLSGRIEGVGPFRGRLVHRGWQATTCNLPAWTGSNDAALVIAPAEVEISSQ
jgi:hypothetical protein